MTIVKASWRNLRNLAVPLMSVLLATYVVAHSPLLGVVARALGLPARRCYFTCSGWIAGGQVTSAAAALLLLVAAAWAAGSVASRVDGRRYERPLMFGLGVLALTVVPSAALGAVGWAVGVPVLRPPLGPLLAAVPALAVLLLTRARGRRPTVADMRLHRWPRGLELVLGVLAAALLTVSVVITLGHPPTGYDALSYHGPMAVYFWRDGDLGALLERTPWAWALAHPGTAELWFGLLRIAAGERVASLGQLPFALLGSAAVYAFGRRTGLGAAPSRLGALAFLLAPIVVVQAGSQVNDLAAGALLMTAAALAVAPVAEWNTARYVGVGTALGLAVTTKLAALPSVAVVAIYVAAVALRRGALPHPERPEQRRLVGVFAALGAGAVVAAPWWVRNLMMFGNPIYPAALPLFGRGYVVGDFVKKDDWFVPATWAWPLYPLIEPHSDMSGFGALFAVGALLGLAVAVVLRRRRGPLVLYGLLTTVSVPAWWMLSQREPRLLLGLFGLGFAFLGWALLAVPRSRRRAAALVCALAAIISTSVTADQALRPLARAPSDRAEFYDRIWNIDSTVAGMPERDGLLYHTGHARLSYAGDYPLLGPSLGRVLIVVDGTMSTDSIVALMRRAGVRYAYVPAAEDAWPAIRGIYAPPRFELMRSSSATAGKQRGVRRYLFRLREP